MKHFEACIGGQWMAWDATDSVKIKHSKTAGLVEILTSSEKDGQSFTLKTIINLSQTPAYASY